MQGHNLPKVIPKGHNGFNEYTNKKVPGNLKLRGQVECQNGDQLKLSDFNLNPSFLQIFKERFEYIKDIYITGTS